MADYYSNLYALNNSNVGTAGGYTAINAANNCRGGESVFIRASVSIPAGAVATDRLIFAPLVPGLRPVYGILTATATNGSLTVNLGYETSASAIVAASTAFQAAGSTLLTPAQIAGVTVLTSKGSVEAGQDRLIGTLVGTFTNPTVATVLIQFVNFGS